MYIGSTRQVFPRYGCFVCQQKTENRTGASAFLADWTCWNCFDPTRVYQLDYITRDDKRKAGLIGPSSSPLVFGTQIKELGAEINGRPLADAGKVLLKPLPGGLPPQIPQVEEKAPVGVEL
jgi:hypothetical protein